MSSIPGALLDSLQLRGNASEITFSPAAEIAFIDYTLSVAALTTTLLFLILVLTLTDEARQRTLPYWVNVCFFVTAAAHFLALLFAYHQQFFGLTQSIPLIVTYAVFAAGSRTIGDSVLLMRVRKSFPRRELLLVSTVGLVITARTVLEVLGRVWWNVAHASSPIWAIVASLALDAPRVITIIYPW